MIAYATEEMDEFGLSSGTEPDCERALVGYSTSSTRAKWRALRSARVSTLEKNLTAPTLLEMVIFCQPSRMRGASAIEKVR